MENLIKKKFNNLELGIEFESFIDEECCVWFKAKQVAQILGYQKERNAIKKHVSEKYKKEASIQGPLVGEQKCVIISESGFYELVFKSKLPAAKMFREWVFEKVLPSIRKYGYFNMYKSKRKRRVIIDGVKFYKHPEFSNYAANKDGDVINLKTKKIMNKCKNNSGYLFFGIYNKKLKKPKSYSQHRFVYEVFKGKIPSNFEIDHINENKTDNRIKNLQLLTHQQNVEKSRNKPIISTCLQTGEERKFDSIKKASIELFVDKSNICNICKNKKSNKSSTSKKDGKNIPSVTWISFNIYFVILKLIYFVILKLI